MALNSANQPIRWVQRIGIFILGFTANKAMVYWYDFTVYPSFIVNYGLVQGWLYAAAGSTILCLATLWFYNLTKQDWLLLEAAKEIRDGQAFGKIRKFFRILLHRGDALAFILLSLSKDAFIATVYMRKGNGNYAMTARDWEIFWSSTLVSEVWWGLLVFGATEGFKNWLAPHVPDWLHLAIGAVGAFNGWLVSFVPSYALNWFGFN